MFRVFRSHAEKRFFKRLLLTVIVVEIIVISLAYIAVWQIGLKHEWVIILAFATLLLVMGRAVRMNVIRQMRITLWGHPSLSVDRLRASGSPNSHCEKGPEEDAKRIQNGLDDRSDGLLIWLLMPWIVIAIVALLFG